MDNKLIAVSYFNNKTDTVPKLEEVQWSTLKQSLSVHAKHNTKGGKRFSGNVYKSKTKRKQINVDYMTLLILDFDEGIATFNEITDPLREKCIAFFLYTTFSHTTDKSCFRVVIPLAKPVPANEWPEVFSRLNYHVGMNKADDTYTDASHLSNLPEAPAKTYEQRFTDSDDSDFLDPNNYPAIPTAEPQPEPTPAQSEQKIEQDSHKASKTVFNPTPLTEIMNKPRLLSVIKDIIHERTTSVLSAETGSFKSFIALDMLVSVVTGMDWQGYGVKQGNGLYLLAEGEGTIQDRTRGLCLHRGIEIPSNLYIVTMPLNTASKAEVEAFLEEIKSLNLVLIIIDTLSQCAEGLNENDNSQMADFIRGMSTIAKATNAHVMVIHHHGKDSGTYRGASSILSNVDAKLTMNRQKGTNKVNVHFEKTKYKVLESIVLEGREIGIGTFDEYGEPISTLVFDVIKGETPAQKVHPSTQRSNQTLDRLMQVFDDIWNQNNERHGGVKQGMWMKKSITTEEGNICSRTSFLSHVKQLIKTGVIEQVTICANSPVYARKASSSSNTGSSSSTTCTMNSIVQVVQQPLGVVLPERSNSADSLESPLVPSKQQNNGNKAESETYKATEVTI